VKVEPLTRLGELLREMPKAKGAAGSAGPGRGKRGAIVEPRFHDAPTLAELGIDKKVSSVAQQLAALPHPRNSHTATSPYSQDRAAGLSRPSR
jgi:hypothetical protein